MKRVIKASDDTAFNQFRSDVYNALAYAAYDNSNMSEDDMKSAIEFFMKKFYQDRRANTGMLDAISKAFYSRIDEYANIVAEALHIGSYVDDVELKKILTESDPDVVSELYYDLAYAIDMNGDASPELRKAFTS